MFKSLLYTLILLFIGVNSLTFASKIKDLTNIEGVRDNQLIGYGLVVGLNGTGDRVSQVPFTIQTLNNMLSQLGIKIPIINNNSQLKNIASVIVTAKLPPFGLQGEKINVIVSSIGNSSSLEGGVLLMTPLKGIDNQIYAIAQGKILIQENYSYSEKDTISFNKKKFNSGKIIDGGIIERELKNNFNNNNIIKLQLYKDNFTLAKQISDNINYRYNNIATAINAKSIVIDIKSFKNVEKINIISNIQNIDIPSSQSKSKIIINSKMGAVVISKSIKLNPCSITYKNFTIFVDKFKKYSYQSTNFNRTLNKKHVSKINTNATLSNIIHTLNLFGIKPHELISILETMKLANCLSTKIETFHEN
ncbi:flagellar P-ring protein [Buchnera aphidicola (Nipponaphis monzeni)]|uniref:Flagellar P-ring protein n=1 Tax=Buchnera aphidicola (Nipponaphis monzeni) TaxID=2495405 RepID=A0A455TAA4_9GAMM|nr:flagellar basal body P-ring protein FlgI [Buchnera aphidicola]BBI01274.1 flagellar P-ring protein [Buchnera aphidicola (Nipponaphis monzeni)]